jgi:SpoVK/Ycf46/Vps4 family AAA+-type ATPase
MADDVDPELVTVKTEGYSGSDYRDIFQAAQMRVAREVFDGPASKGKGPARAITIEDFKEILRKRRPSVSPQMLGMYDKWFDTYKAL